MRHLSGVGVEYGTDWVVKELLNELTPINISERFEASIEDCYPSETQLGWLSVNTIESMKRLDPVSWRLAQVDWVAGLEVDGEIISFDNGTTYFEPEDIEQFLRQAR